MYSMASSGFGSVWDFLKAVVPIAPASGSSGGGGGEDTTIPGRDWAKDPLVIYMGKYHPEGLRGMSSEASSAWWASLTELGYQGQPVQTISDSVAAVAATVAQNTAPDLATSIHIFQVINDAMRPYVQQLAAAPKPTSPLKYIDLSSLFTKSAPPPAKKPVAPASAPAPKAPIKPLLMVKAPTNWLLIGGIAVVGIGAIALIARR